MPNCYKCKKPLMKIGRDRKNGIDFQSNANYNKDWKQRRYHKKCWKQHQDDIMWDFMIKEKQLEILKKQIDNEKFIVRFK